MIYVPNSASGSTIHLLPTDTARYYQRQKVSALAAAFRLVRLHAGGSMGRSV